MPLTQEKLIKSLDNSFSNNNDHSYLHKKFKKMASTVPTFSSSPPKDNLGAQRDADVSQPGSNTFISNGSISAAHPEIEKIKEIPHLNVKDVEKNVQINISNGARLSNIDNMQMPGHTIYTEEFSNKTENLENEFIRETQTGGTSGRLPYECPYCKLCCAKPSVLQKHIRAHTNERPYPCVPCGFAFKTKSNLYKHRRSRTHALRLLGAEVPGSVNDDESAGSESDTSIPPISSADTGPDVNIVRNETFRPNDFSSPELTNDSMASNVSSNDNCKLKSIYKPKFRGAFYQDLDDKDISRKNISSKADFLTEHISKIISDNEAIVDVIETPLQKKYNKIKLIAESKQFMNENDTKSISSPLNLTKQNNETETQFRKRSHSESFSHNDQLKHLNPEGSIIKDLLLKANLQPITNEATDGIGPLYVCPLCQIMYRSVDNLEIHRLYYCKGSNHVQQAGQKSSRSENIYMRSNSVNVRLPESQRSPPIKATKLTQLRNKPDNLTILKPEQTDVIAPLPSPGPLLGHTRLVDARTHEYARKPDNQRVRQMISPKRRMDSNSETYSPRVLENVSPKTDVYIQSKIRCIDANSVALRAIEDMSSHGRHNSTSLQMFGGEVKILDHSGSTTTLRIEPSKNQLSPIMIHQSISPSKLNNDAEASSVVVRSGLHSGGTIVHNPPTPKDAHVTQNQQTQRVCTTPRSTGMNLNMPNMQDVTHFQFPPLSAITAYNPLTLPPLSPSSSPNGATTILHGGKLIPHVPGIPGPNTPGLFVGSPSPNGIVVGNDVNKSGLHTPGEFENYSGVVHINKSVIPNYNRQTNIRSPSLRGNHLETDKIEKQVEEPRYTSPVPIIKVRNVDEPNPKTFQVVKPFVVSRTDASIKRNADGVPKNQTQKEFRIKTKDKNISQDKHAESKTDNNIRHFNFENLITKAEIYNNNVANSTESIKPSNFVVYEEPASALHERSETSYFKKNAVAKSIQEDKKSKFLRPSTLPLKPGTFTPKRHHGITPNANTMPLVSPETPRPAKAYGQLYLNGNAYTYLGLKCSTKVFYCTINRPQPTYVPNQHFLSMYSNWQLLSELTPDPLGLSAASAMSLYDSRHRPQNNTIATMKQDLILTHSSQWNKNSKENKDVKSVSDVKKWEDNKISFSDSNLPKKELAGGFESNEEYTYVRGRGRGRYVCSECGIRCKKPSMLKKHIRTHTDVRPYTCIHCAFSFKTKGNLTKHMKSKAHYKKCCELGINPNEGQDADNGEAAHCSGETDDDSDSDGDEGNEGETESSDTEMCKSRLPDHEAAHCLLSLGGSRPTTSATSGLMSARPSTYPYTPAAGDSAQDMSSDRSQVSRSSSVDSRIDLDNEPMDLSKSDVKVNNLTEIPTARESSVLASLASNTAKLPQHQSQWPNGEPMLHTYLTERALLDSKIKQSQLSYNLNKKMDVEKTTFKDNLVFTSSGGKIMHIETYDMPSQDVVPKVNSHSDLENCHLSATSPKDEISVPADPTENTLPNSKIEPERKVSRTPSSNAENAKQVVSEYLKQAKINLILDDNKLQSHVDKGSDECKGLKSNTDDSSKEDNSDSDSIKLPSLDHDSVARKVVVGMGGVAFKVSKGKDYDSSTSFSPSRLMEDGRRVCDFCNKTFTKPSQLRLHLNIHYMERPFRCSVCAVSFRTRGHLQKHERSGSHHNKVSMTSTFGAATSCNPRPFRCFDCNIAFRIHGHLAKHLRSKMHVMRLECLFKLPFGTFTEIERAGVSLTEIDTTDCASSLASLQTLARKLHEKDPTKLEYHELNNVSPGATSSSVKDSGEEECLNVESFNEDSEKDSAKIVEKNECNENESSYL